MNKKQSEYYRKRSARHKKIYQRAIEDGLSSRKAAIRAKCLDCMLWQESLVNSCDINWCPLWPYRMGGKAQVAGP